MAITGQFNLHPYGYGAEPEELVNFRIHTSDDNQRHVYRIWWHNHDIRGSIRKTVSGHRNLLHVLAAILEDCHLDAFAENYISRRPQPPKPMHTLEND